MSVLYIVVFVIKPESAGEFVETPGGMFSETRTHRGFISIRLLKSETAESEFIPLQNERRRGITLSMRRSVMKTVARAG